jgi:hypothetical protein
MLYANQPDLSRDREEILVTSFDEIWLKLLNDSCPDFVHMIRRTQIQ